MFAALGAAENDDVWWVLASVPLYAVASTALHIAAARGIFTQLLARRA